MSLLAVTNQICQDVAVVPFFWVVPLSLYLLTFIICFDSEWWYRRVLFALATLVLTAMIGAILLQEEVQPFLKWLGISQTIPDFLDSITLEATLYLSVLFCVCMLCHGELVLRKPAPRHLTLFYLMISAGGALGGLFVALVCPMVFSEYLESNIFLVGGALIAILIILQAWWERERRWQLWWKALSGYPLLLVRDLIQSLSKRDLVGDPLLQKQIFVAQRIVVSERRWWTLWSVLVPLPLVAAIALFGYFGGQYRGTENLVSRRSFYGVLRVADLGDDGADARRSLYNGRILHGTQFRRPNRRREPTTYYNLDSGIGLTLQNLKPDDTLRVATVGLGTGTIAAYGEEGDYYCFYEINPDVIDIAHQYFTYLSDSPAHPVVKLGDARLSMEQQSPQNYDVIALDAFSGDAIPAHLLTVEAFAVYLRHLKSDGVLAVHTSNRHLDLQPIVALLAEHYHMHVVLIDAIDHEGVADSSSEWLLVTNNIDFLTSQRVQEAAITVAQPGPSIRVWTDQYSNLFQILRAWHDYPPVVDLDRDDSSGESEGDFATTYHQGSGPVHLVDTDAALHYPAETQLRSLEVTITNAADNPEEMLDANTEGTSITAQYDPAACMLRLSGADSVEHYLQVLRTLTYEDVAETPDPTPRIITFVARDGISKSAIVTSLVSIDPATAAPSGTPRAD